MRILKVTPMVKDSEMGKVIHLEYTGELDDGTQITRKLFGVQDAIAMATDPRRAMLDLALNDLRAEAARLEAERIRKEALERTVETISTTDFSELLPYEPPPPAPPEEETAGPEVEETAEEETETEEVGDVE